MEPIPDLLTPAAACRQFGVCRNTLTALRERGVLLIPNWHLRLIAVKLTKTATGKFGGEMPLNKSKGNMYPWVSHTHAHLGGECPHKCVYCYVDNPRWGRPPRYAGPLRLLEQEFKVDYGEGKVIFIEHMNDMWAREVPEEFALRIFDHCWQYPDNTYVFQTKNPARYHELQGLTTIPLESILGCTIETNREIPAHISLAPQPKTRMLLMEKLPGRKFITIEPVMDFDVDILASWIDRIRPEFLNLGADSKDHELPEPTVEKIHAFVRKLQEYGIELREKHNLNRLKPK